MNTGTRMTDGCHRCEGRFSVVLPKGAPRARARFTPVLELHDPKLAGLCIELHLHGGSGADELVQTVRLIVDPHSREVRHGESAGVRIIALFERPSEWPVLRTVRGSRLPREPFMLDRLVISAFPEFCYDVPPDDETTGGEGVLIAQVPIAAMWTYPAAPEGK